MAEHASTLAALMLLVGASSATAHPAHPVTPAGAYETMSPANQNIARALYDAQTLTALSGGGARKRLTLEQIMAMKRNGTGWTPVVTEMQRRGLLQKDRTLAEIVSRYNRMSRPVAMSAHRAVPKLNSEPVARGWNEDEALSAPAALAGTPALEPTGDDLEPAR